MKRKHVIATFALSALMGIGVFAGVRANKVKETKAATATTVYCAVDVASLKTTYSISDENFVMKCNVNRQGDASNWQTYTMLDTKSVYDSKTVYSASFTDLYNGLGCLQFQVHDQSKGSESWKAQDQVISSWTTVDTYNGKIHVYGGSGWTAYTPSSYKVNVYVNGNPRGEETVGAGALPVTPDLDFGQRFSGWYDNAEMTEGHQVNAITGATTVYGAVIDIPTVTYNLDLTAVSEEFAHPYLHAWNNLKNHEWPGVPQTGNTFTVPNDAQIIIANSTDGTKEGVTAQTVDIAQSGVANDTLTILATKTGDKYNYVWESEKCSATLSVTFDVNVPEYVDIFIPGAFNGWSDDVTVSKMTRVSSTEFTYALNDIMPGSYQYKIVACYSDVTKMDWDNQITADNQTLEFAAEDDGKTLDLGTKTYDFAGKFPAPVVPAVYTLKVGTGAPVTLTNVGDEYVAENITVAVGDTFTFTKDEAAYAPAARNIGNNNYGKNGIRVAGTVNVYLKPSTEDFWVSGTVAPAEVDTYYMLVNDKNPVLLTDNTAYEPREYYITHVELAVDDEISFLYVGTGESATYAIYNIETLKEGSVDFYQTDSNKVKTAGIYDFYAHMENGNDYLYVALNTEGWVRYLDINGTKHAMTVNPEKDYEYMFTTNLVAGDELAYYFGPDAASATEQTSSAKAIHNNNLGADKKVLVDADNATVCVNKNNGEIWVGGLPNDGFHLIKNGHTLVTMTHGDEYDGYDQWFSASIAFAKDDEITFINATEARGEQLPEIFGIGTIEESDEGAKFEVVDGTPKVIKAKEAITTRVYLKFKYGMDRVYFGAEEQYIRDAKEFAKDFKDNLATACKASGQQKAVEDAWKDAVDAYALLAKEAKDELKKGSSSSVEEIREFGARYTWFLEHKSTWNLADFLEWNVQPSNDVMGLTADDTTMTVVVISAIAVISAAGLFFLIRRKRRLVK